MTVRLIGVDAVQIGVIVETDASSIPYKVKAVTGSRTTHWYRSGAIQAASSDEVSLDPDATAFQTLILQPIKTLLQRLQIVILLDGLDEGFSLPQSGADMLGTPKMWHNKMLRLVCSQLMRLPGNVTLITTSCLDHVGANSIQYALHKAATNHNISLSEWTIGAMPGSNEIKDYISAKGVQEDLLRDLEHSWMESARGTFSAQVCFPSFTASFSALYTTTGNAEYSTVSIT